MQERMNRVYKAADSYPPNLSSAEERADVERDWTELEKTFISLADRNPSSVGMKLNLGSIYRMGYNLDIEGSGEKAERTLRAAIALAPKEFRAHFLLGIFFGSSGRFEDAVKELQIAIPLATNEDDRLNAACPFALNSYRSRRFKEALPAAIECLKIIPDDEGIALIKRRSQEAMAGGRERTLLDRPSDGLAPKHASGNVRSRPGEYLVPLSRADGAFLQGQLNRIYKAANSYPPSLSSKEERVAVETVWHEAERRLAALVQAEPRNADLKATLGNLYRMGHNLDVEDAGKNAERTLRAAIDIAPKAFWPHFDLGSYYTSSASFDKGRKELETALALAPLEERLRVVFALAFSNYYLERYKEAVRFASEYLEEYSRDGAMTMIKKRSEEVLAGGRKPRMVKGPVVDRPEEKIKRAPIDLPPPTPVPTPAGQ